MHSARLRAGFFEQPKMPQTSNVLVGLLALEKIIIQPVPFRNFLFLLSELLLYFSSYKRQLVGSQPFDMHALQAAQGERTLHQLGEYFKHRSC